MWYMLIQCTQSHTSTRSFALLDACSLTCPREKPIKSTTCLNYTRAFKLTLGSRMNAYCHVHWAGLHLLASSRKYYKLGFCSRSIRKSKLILSFNKLWEVPWGKSLKTYAWDWIRLHSPWKWSKLTLETWIWINIVLYKFTTCRNR